MPKPLVGLFGVGIVFLSSVHGRADSPPPRVRQICDPTLPENAEVCIPDTFEIIFGTDKSSTNSVFEYSGPPPEEDIDVTIVTDTKSAKVQGWSYGVEHDPSYLEILEATVGGTDGAFGLIGGFDATSLDVEKCDDVKCANRTEGSGFLSATVLDFKKHKPLLLQRNSLCKAKYRVINDAGWDGTYMAITNLLAARGSPPCDINVTVDGRSKRWTNATDGWVRKHNGGDPECSYELDDDADGKSNCEEAECLGTPECVESNCIDGIDNEGDQKIDCDDEDCADKPCGPSSGQFNRADADGNGKHNLLDAILLSRMILGELPLRYDCQDILDANDDGKLNVTDALALVEWVFKDEPDLPAPFRACALDPTEDSLDCGESNCG